MTKTVLPWAESAGFQVCTEDGRLIGPFDPTLLHPEITGSFLQLQLDEGEHTSLTERVRQVVILTVGAVWRADYELYAHAAVALKARLTEDAIRALGSGGQPDVLTDQEGIAHRVARQLSVEHQLDDELYREAEQTFGSSGVLDIVLLAGIYHTVCATLNAFDIPAPA
ncbi:MAG: carboxymuconolactone decarboxylase family protein [Planctomycetaceae bacterium]|nr:carboxymuconolactone decarboxylase family protein [Planctomycetaceae bacterium]